MLTALPPSPKTAIEDDRPIVVGRVERPDFYVLAHEAKSRGNHIQAADLLLLAARDLGIHYGHSPDSCWEWDTHIEVVDRAWGEKQEQLAEQSQPAPNPVQIMRVPGHSIFIDAVMLHESDRPVAAATLLLVAANDLEVEGDWSGTFKQDWERNFEGVHQSWVEKWSKLQ